MQDEFTDRLSDYLDDELPPHERRDVDAHLAQCDECRRTLDELTQVVAKARSLPPRLPSTDLWSGIATRVNPQRPAWRISFTLPQLAAASLLLAALSGGLVWLATRHANVPSDTRSAGLQARDQDGGAPVATAEADPAENVLVVPVALADEQYAAAVADLERTLAKGRGRLDRATVAIVEENLRIIDHAIEQARQALAADPANSYLSGHLLETRRKKLDLLRRATALTSDTD